jgi:hypothetical protein
MAEKVRDPVNREVIFCAAGVLSASPLTYFMRRDGSDLAVFCFANPEDAEAFAKHFGGESCRGAAGGDPENKRPTCVAQDERKVRNVSSCMRTGPMDGQRCSVRFGLKVTHLCRRPPNFVVMHKDGKFPTASSLVHQLAYAGLSTTIWPSAKFLG